MSASVDDVPRALRQWFVVHFWADLVFALPLFLAPGPLLRWLGWSEPVDEALARLAAAALVGIGGESLLGRGRPRASFVGMLELKLLWSSTAAVGLGWSVLSGGAPAIVWGFAAIFVGFFGLWGYWYRRLRGPPIVR